MPGPHLFSPIGSVSVVAYRDRPHLLSTVHCICRIISGETMNNISIMLRTNARLRIRNQEIEICVCAVLEGEEREDQ